MDGTGGRKGNVSEVGEPPWLLPRAAYVHIPFCAHHCNYCDFAVVEGRDASIDLYLDALEREMMNDGEGEPISTLFIGGGTPTHLHYCQLIRLGTILRRRFELLPDTEFSIEANPNSIDAEKAIVLADIGVNRVSLGTQSFQPELLVVLERQHGPDETARVIDLLGPRIANVSIDLIFGTPGQTPAQWQHDLETAVQLGIAHISTYGLTYEKGTRLWKQRERGDLHSLDEESERAMYALAMDYLEANGFEQYEISSFARPGYRCRHNQVYWANHAYYGYGLGAARYVHGKREVNTRDFDGYLKKCLAGESATQQSEELSPEERARETAMLNLRRREGIHRADFQRQTRFRIDELAGATLAKFVCQRLLADDGYSISLLREGKFFADLVCGAMIDVDLS